MDLPVVRVICAASPISYAITQNDQGRRGFWYPSINR